jgi:hypothetical protein
VAVLLDATCRASGHAAGIGGVHARDVTIGNNSLVAGERGQVMTFRGNFDGLRVEGNRIVAPGVQARGVRLSAMDGFSANGVPFVDNQIEVAGVGIELIDPGSSIELRGNRILGRSQSIGISVRLNGTSPTVHRDVKIVGNTIGDFADAGIHVSTSNTNERYDGVEISGNEIYADSVPSSTTLTGIRLARPGNGNAPWLQDAVKRVATARAPSSGRIVRRLGRCPEHLYHRSRADRPTIAMAARTDVVRVTAGRRTFQVAAAAQLDGSHGQRRTPRPVSDLRWVSMVGQPGAKSHRRDGPAAAGLRVYGVSPRTVG